MFDLQGMMNMTQTMLRESRSRYHLTLGQLIQRLEPMPEIQPILTVDGQGIEGLGSYRGYYTVTWPYIPWKVWFGTPDSFCANASAWWTQS
jgi:hypothetical protein